MDGAKSKKGDSMKKFIISGIVSVAMASALMAAEGDIVFVIDESGSMGPYIATVKANVDSFVQQLEDNGVDYQLGLVGFGWNYTPNPHVVTQLTSDKATFISGLNSLVAYGGHEPGFSAVSLGLSTAMEPEPFRPDAGTCVIMITDEDADDPQNQAVALTALDDKTAIYYGIVRTGDLGTQAHYGMNPGSLATETGGSVWDIGLFGTTAVGQAIMTEVMAKCISEAIMPEVYFDIHPGGCPNPLNKNSKGVTPMAILGTADFNVEDINVSSLKVNGYSPVHSALEDVGTPYEDGFSDPLSRDDCNEIGADGFMDLTLNFTTQEILNDVEKGVQTMEITGQKYDGTEITGKDVVWVK